MWVLFICCVDTTEKLLEKQIVLLTRNAHSVVLNRNELSVFVIDKAQNFYFLVAVLL